MFGVEKIWKFHSVFGNAVVNLRLSLAHVLVMCSGKNIHILSLVDPGMFLLKIQNEQPKCGWTIIKVTSKSSIRFLKSNLEFYFASVPSARHVKVGDISERLAIREKLQCKPFRPVIKFIL